MKCAKCGNEQPGGTECLRCGVVFGKAKREHQPVSHAETPPQVKPSADPRDGMRALMTNRWLRPALFGAFGVVAGVFYAWRSMGGGFKSILLGVIAGALAAVVAPLLTKHCPECGRIIIHDHKVGQDYCWHCGWRGFARSRLWG